MRINKFVAQATGISRRAADRAIIEGRVTINHRTAALGDTVSTATNSVILDSQTLTLPAQNQTIIFNKPVGYICSRDGQGSRTIYDLLPRDLHHLKTVGRLDKNSSGLLLLTTDGDLANQLTHPRYAKTKIYEITLDRSLAPNDHKIITGNGVTLEDGPSRLRLKPLNDHGTEWQITMQEGRNRQIRRTFQALGYQVAKLHRTHFGDYVLGSLSEGRCQELS
jgi:23S rRNA pseudouridine2605 synthase